jgi:hypothetical protein
MGTREVLGTFLGTDRDQEKSGVIWFDAEPKNLSRTGCPPERTKETWAARPKSTRAKNEGPIPGARSETEEVTGSKIRNHE